MDSAELRKRVDDVVGAIAAETAVLVFIKHLDFAGSVILSENTRSVTLPLERHLAFGCILMTASGAGQFFADLGESLIYRLAFKQGFVSAMPTDDFYCTHDA